MAFWHISVYSILKSFTKLVNINIYSAEEKSEQNILFLQQNYLSFEVQIKSFYLKNNAPLQTNVL